MTTRRFYYFTGSLACLCRHPVHAIQRVQQLRQLRQLTLTVLVVTIDEQWEGMGDVGMYFPHTRP